MQKFQNSLKVFFTFSVFSRWYHGEKNNIVGTEGGEEMTIEVKIRAVVKKQSMNLHAFSKKCTLLLLNPRALEQVSSPLSRGMDLASSCLENP